MVEEWPELAVFGRSARPTEVSSVYDRYRPIACLPVELPRPLKLAGTRCPLPCGAGRLPNDHTKGTRS